MYGGGEEEAQGGAGDTGQRARVCKKTVTFQTGVETQNLPGQVIRSAEEEAGGPRPRDPAVGDRKLEARGRRKSLCLV